MNAGRLSICLSIAVPIDLLQKISLKKIIGLVCTHSFFSKSVMNKCGQRLRQSQVYWEDGFSEAACALGIRGSGVLRGCGERGEQGRDSGCGFRLAAGWEESSVAREAEESEVVVASGRKDGGWATLFHS